MSYISGVHWYILTSDGPRRIYSIRDDIWQLLDMDNNMVYASATMTFLSPIFKSLTEFKLAHPEEFI